MENKRHIPAKMLILCVLIFFSAGLYLYARILAKSISSGLPLTVSVAGKIASRSGVSILGIIISAVMIAAVSLVFQTITESRILTPGMLGFDSVFLATQSILLFFSNQWTWMGKWFSNTYLNFIATSAVMVVVSMLMYSIMLRKDKNNIVFLLLFGLILSNIVQSLTNYIQVLLNPQQFQQLQAATTVSLVNMNKKIVLFVLPVVVLILVYFGMKSREYDVMQLGETQARSLGVPYSRNMNVSLFLIALGMAVTTAMVGSLTFLGLLAVNIAKELLRTYRHSVLLVGSALVSVLFLLLGQGIVELLRSSIPVSVLINLVGGIYMIVLILRVNRT